MEHVVFYPGPEAQPAFRRCASLEEAVHFVEHLRNVEGVSEFAVHALTPVPLAFRAYYRVEMPAADAAGDLAVVDAPAEVVADAPAAEPAPEPVADVPAAEVPAQGEAVEAAMPAEPVLVEAAATDVVPASNGKRSLGFFSS